MIGAGSHKPWGPQGAGQGDKGAAWVQALVQSTRSWVHIGALAGAPCWVHQGQCLVHQSLTWACLGALWTHCSGTSKHLEYICRFTEVQCHGISPLLPPAAPPQRCRHMLCLTCIHSGCASALHPVRQLLLDASIHMANRRLAKLMHAAAPDPAQGIPLSWGVTWPSS